MLVPVSNTKDPDEEPEDKELKDEEVEELQSVQKTLYIDWLRLMVAHFDAIEIILQYVMLINFNHKSISVTNLVAPLTSMDLYSWEEPVLYPPPLILPGSRQNARNPGRSKQNGRNLVGLQVNSNLSPSKKKNILNARFLTTP